MAIYGGKMIKRVIILIMTIFTVIYAKNKHIIADEYQKMKARLVTFKIAAHKKVSKKDPVLQKTFFIELTKSLKNVTSDKTCKVVKIKKEKLTKIITVKLSKKEEIRFYAPEDTLTFIDTSIYEGFYCPDVILFLKYLSFGEKERERMKMAAKGTDYQGKVQYAGEIETVEYIQPSSYYIYWDNKAQRAICFGEVIGKSVPRYKFKQPNVAGIEKSIKKVVDEIANHAPVIVKEE